MRKIKFLILAFMLIFTIVVIGGTREVEAVNFDNYNVKEFYFYKTNEATVGEETRTFSDCTSINLASNRTIFNYFKTANSIYNGVSLANDFTGSNFPVQQFNNNNPGSSIDIYGDWWSIELIGITSGNDTARTCTISTNTDVDIYESLDLKGKESYKTKDNIVFNGRTMTTPTHYKMSASNGTNDSSKVYFKMSSSGAGFVELVLREYYLKDNGGGEVEDPTPSVLLEHQFSTDADFKAMRLIGTISGYTEAEILTATIEFKLSLKNTVTEVILTKDYDVTTVYISVADEDTKAGGDNIYYVVLVITGVDAETFENAIGYEFTAQLEVTIDSNKLFDELDNALTVYAVPQ